MNIHGQLFIKKIIWKYFGQQNNICVFLLVKFSVMFLNDYIQNRYIP